MNLEIAGRLLGLRREHGLSQEELAARLGVSRQAVSKWERAESSPDTDNLIALARLYGISLDGLLLTGGAGGGAAGGGAAAAAAVEPGAAPEPAAEEDEDADLFAKAAAWDAADEAAREKGRARWKKRLLAFPYPVFLVILYLALGFTFGLWHPGWMLFLTTPIYYCAVSAL